MAGKTEVSFPSLRLGSRQAQKLQKNKSARQKKTPTLVHSEFGELFGGEQASSGGEQVTLGNWVSLFAGGSGLGLYT